MSHIPVLLHEVIEFLKPQPNQDFIDATFGAGGHSRALLERVAPRGRVLALDRDPRAVDSAQPSPDNRLVVARENFSALADTAARCGFKKVSGVLFDLGLSSDELDDPTRGFSFQQDGPLDMRYDQTSGPRAADLLKLQSEEELVRIFKEYGEERFARRIARAIVAARRKWPLQTTKEFFALISLALPAEFRFKVRDSARRIFQALRIAVNHELDHLAAALPQALDLLRPGGRLGVISFHSLEDRMVKQFFLQAASGCICPPEFPRCVCGKNPRGRVVTKKPITASMSELRSNPRARPAKLRVLEKIKQN